MSTSAITSLFNALQSSYTTTSQAQFPPGSKFAKVDPTKWQGTWTATDSKGKPVTLTISNVSGYRATVRFTNAESGLQTGRVMINTNGIFRIGNSQMQLTGAGKMTISTVVTDSTTGKQSMETDHAKLQS
ncbi:hypothetical protein [Bradyrhizobium sp.]|uniref:hypothetical protein n=1 Tax=Bradyrhizobium sp. TaxID=376 RepID=UPI002D720A5C|nr:hypothetical protein [Bradyrhizobium sp.]HZR77399.1 hypothetical protein [Bradyrhizobium sp.]